MGLTLDFPKTLFILAFGLTIGICALIGYVIEWLLGLTDPKCVVMDDYGTLQFCKTIAEAESWIPYLGGNWEILDYQTESIIKRGQNGKH